MVDGTSDRCISTHTHLTWIYLLPNSEFVVPIMLYCRLMDYLPEHI